MIKEDWKEECKKYIKERGYIIRPNKSVYIRHEIIDFGYNNYTIIGGGKQEYINDYDTFKEQVNKMIKKYKELQIKLKRKEIEKDFENEL